MTLLGPDLHRAAALPAFGGVEAQQTQQPGDAVAGDLAEKRDVQQVAVVEQRGGLRDRALGLVGCDAVDEERARRDADAERGPERRLADRVAQPFDGGSDGRMFRRIERPVARRDEQRPGHAEQAL